MRIVLKVGAQILASSSSLNLPNPPIFIIGSPRSGTTLLYQILVSRYHIGYISNFSAQFPSTLISATWLENHLLKSLLGSKGNYSSKYGRTQGLLGPHEAGEFWYRWFPREECVYVSPGTTPETHLIELRREVSGMNKVSKAPVLFKNTYNSMRIAPIVEAFPEACFLVCRRDPIDTAQSILNARIEANGDKHAWWSLPPKEIEQIRHHSPCEQVVEQVYYIYQQIEEDRRQFGSDHFYDVHYECLCKAPHETLSGIEQFLDNNGLTLKVRDGIPTRFSVSSGQKVSDEDYKCIVQKVNELWG